eukprot:1136672-Pelagomonas_calceolata.AAC.1
MKLPVKFLAMPDVPTFFEAVWMPTLKRSIAPAGLKRGVPVAQGKVEATALCKKALACMQVLVTSPLLNIPIAFKICHSCFSFYDLFGKLHKVFMRH